MKIEKVYSALLTKDLTAAEAWYTTVLDRRPDNRPMPTLVQWELSEDVGLAISDDAEIAGKGMWFVYVEDLDAERARLKTHDIKLGEDIKGDYSTLKLQDPDGNTLILATPPSHPFPAA